MKLPRTQISIRRSGSRQRRAFSLIESLFALAVLGITSLSIVSAMSASQKLSFEGQKRILAAIAADDLMIEMMTLSYPDILAQDGRSETPGAMETIDGADYPESFWAIGRRVTVIEETILEPGMGILIRGLRITITAEDESADLAQVEMFLPEPA